MVEQLVITNNKLGESLEMDMSTANYLIYEGSVDWGNVEVSHSTYQYPSLAGKYITNTALGSRSVSIAGWIVGTQSEIYSKKLALSRCINPLDEVSISVGDYQIIGKPDSSVSFGKDRAENNTVMCKFLIQILCPFPLFKLKKAIRKPLSSDIPAFHFPLIIPKDGIIMSHRQRNLFVDVVNDGTVEIGCTFIFKAKGTVNNPSVIDVDTSKRIKINKTLNAGEEVHISTEDGNKYVKGFVDGEELNYYRYFDYDNEYLKLASGYTTFTYLTETDEGERDDTYNMLEIYVVFNPCRMNLEEE